MSRLRSSSVQTTMIFLLRKDALVSLRRVSQPPNFDNMRDIMALDNMAAALFQHNCLCSLHRL